MVILFDEDGTLLKGSYGRLFRQTFVKFLFFFFFGRQIMGVRFTLAPNRNIALTRDRY